MQQTAFAAPAEPGIALPRPTLTWVARAAAFALGLVLLVATFAKALDPRSFAEMLQNQGLTFGLPPMVAAVLALAVEGGLGLLLVLGIRRRWSLAAVTLLVIGFVTLNGWEWWRAAHGAPPAAGCGCFGNLVQRSPAAAFWQDLAMLVPLLLLSWLALPRDSRALPPRRTAAAVVGIAAIAMLAWRAPELPLDDVATRLKPGVELSQLCAGKEPRVCLDDVLPDAASGRAWVVLVDLEQGEHWADALNAFAAGQSTPVMALASATPEEKTAFTWQWGPTFPVHEADAVLLRPLYRTLPRSFLVEDGRVLRTVPGLPADGHPDVPGDSTR